MTAVLHSVIVQQALHLAKPSILKIMEEDAFVWGPKYVAIAAVSNHDELLTLDILNQTPGTWSPDWGFPDEFMEIAVWKAKTALRFQIPTSQLANDYPLALSYGDYFRYAGGVPGPLGTFAVGVSGLTGRADEMNARIVIATMLGIAHTEVDAAIAEKRKKL